MSEFTFEDREILKVLAKGGCIVFETIWWPLPKGALFTFDWNAKANSSEKSFARVYRKTASRLYKLGLLTRRISYDYDSDGHAKYIIFALYTPELIKHDELKDIAIECALGVIK